jgi:hypothetical protein
MDAQQQMMTPLTLDERERIVDSALKIQSVRNSLDTVPAAKVSGMREMLACLKNVDRSLREALGYVRRLRPGSNKTERRT